MGLSGRSDRRGHGENKATPGLRGYAGRLERPERRAHLGHGEQRDLPGLKDYRVSLGHAGRWANAG